MERQFKFSVPLWGNLNAEVAYNELERIRKKYGVLQPEMVVEESRKKKSVLHDCFQWDDTKAAEAWRAEQARQLIKSIVVTVVNENIQTSVRAIVSIAPSPEASRHYLPITEAIVNDTAYNNLLEQAKKEMQSFVLKYQQITELNAVKREMLAVINGIIPESND